MAIQFRDTGAGAASTSVTARSPEAGAWTDNGFWFVWTNGSGRIVTSGFNNFAWSTADVSQDGTLSITMQQEVAGAGTLKWWFRAAATLSSGYSLELLTGTAGISLNRNGTSVATHATGYTAGADNSFIVVVQGGRIRVWVNGNTGTPNIDYTDGSPITTGRVGLEMVGGTSGLQNVDVVEWNDVVSVPGGASSGSASGAVVFTGSATGTLPNPGIAPQQLLRDGAEELIARVWTSALYTGESDTAWPRIADALIWVPVPVAGGSGSATGAVLFTGSATGTLKNEGSATGAVRFTGSATGALKNEGSAAGAVVFTGAASGALRNEGDAAGAVVFTGAATGQQNAGNSGSATGAAVFTGSASGQLRNEGAASGAALFTGSAFGALKVQGAASGVVVFAGLASGALKNEGSADGAVVFTGSASGTQGAPGNGGSAAGAVVFTGAASGALRISGVASGVVVFTGQAGGVDPNPGGGGGSGRSRRKGVRTPYQFTQ